MHIEFDAGAYGTGSVSAQWHDLLDRSSVVATLVKDDALPSAAAAEVLAQALGHEIGFVPRSYLMLRVTNPQFDALSPDAFTRDIAHRALGLLSREGMDVFHTPKIRDHSTVISVPGIRLSPKYFETAHLEVGLSRTGPGLDDPRVFENINPGDALGARGQFVDIESLTHPQNTHGSSQDIPPIVNVDFAVVMDVNKIPKLVLGYQHSLIARGQPVLSAGKALLRYQTGKGRYQVVYLNDDTGHYLVYGQYAKQAAEDAFENEGLGGRHRWFPKFSKPVSGAPFFGLTTERLPSSQASQSFKVYVDDLAASLVIDINNTPDNIARVRNIKIRNAPPEFLSTFLAQALHAVTPTTPLSGIRLHQADVTGLGQALLMDGLTRYGLDQNIGAFNADTPYVVQQHSDSNIEFLINTERQP